jgi:hypothetical protein
MCEVHIKMPYDAGSYINLVSTSRHAVRGRGTSAPSRLE